MIAEFILRRGPRSTKRSEWFWDWRAKQYDKQAEQDEAYSKAVEHFSKYLKADDAVLDYACGTGVVTYKIAADVKEVHAIDTSAGKLQMHILGAIAEFERERIRERVLAGLKRAKAQGKRLGRPRGIGVVASIPSARLTNATPSAATRRAGRSGASGCAQADPAASTRARRTADDWHP